MIEETAKFLTPILAAGAALFIACASQEVAAGSPRASEIKKARAAAWASGQITLNVRETANVARSEEVIRSGIPLPRELQVRETAKLVILDPKGAVVPADFFPLARWNAGLESNQPIQWLLVSFPATVGAGQIAKYRLVTNMKPQAKSSTASSAPTASKASRGQALVIDESESRVAISTGRATFVVGGRPDQLFDEIRLPDGLIVTRSGGFRAIASDKPVHGTKARRRLSVERKGALSAVVVIESTYDLPAVNGGKLSSRLRYTFTAGSPTAIVRHSIQWEGTLCAENTLVCRGQAVNGLLLRRAEDILDLEGDGPPKVLAIGGIQSMPVDGVLPPRSEAWVRQLLRESRGEDQEYEVSVPGQSKAKGTQADAGVLAAWRGGGRKGPTTGIAIALDHMHRYEPQALRASGGGRIGVALLDDLAWIGSHQGLFATFAVSALSASPTLDSLKRDVWAPLNRPLRAWPDAELFADSRAVWDLPTGDLSGWLSSYDKIMASILNETLDQVDKKGLNGVMTFGLYPRNWANPVLTDEIDCGSDPTPDVHWDDPYWCATWTDYHNTLTAAPMWAMRTGEVEWLDEIARPGALRVLHTQIMQCAPDDPWFYCGQAPTGYGGYRADFNSSHAYFENLILHYWLTGDGAVLETLERGASNMRKYICELPGSCPPTHPPKEVWAELSGRVATQWNTVNRFVGLAGRDATFLEHWRTSTARAVTQHYVEAVRNGQRYGFWMSAGSTPKDRNQGATAPIWMATLYDMENLHRLELDTEDAPIGEPPLRPSEIRAAWARTIADLASTTLGDGSAGSTWPASLLFKWTGPRIGGVLQGVEASREGSDPLLYEHVKVGLADLLLRTGEKTGERRLVDLGFALLERGLSSGRQDRLPLGKDQGLFLWKLHPAVAKAARIGAR